MCTCANRESLLHFDQIDEKHDLITSKHPENKYNTIYFSEGSAKYFEAFQFS